jgi:hypothetical protein
VPAQAERLEALIAREAPPFAPDRGLEELEGRSGLGGRSDHSNVEHPRERTREGGRL